MSSFNKIQLAHGGGGQLTGELLEELILPALGGHTKLSALTDSAILGDLGGAAAFTTDSFVVQPLEFPGGDIGKLSICGTLNDLAVTGAEPVALSLSLVLEEGLELVLLERVLRSAGATARDAGVPIVTGDTKVVERGGVRQMIINTAGVGRVRAGANINAARIQAGDRVLISGALGEHGMAVLCRREGLNLRSELRSDCASLAPMAGALIDALGEKIRFMRDPTRGGLAATLVEIQSATGRAIEVRERDIPVNATAHAAAEILGLDLLSVANEGKLAVVVCPDAAEQALEIMRSFELGIRAADIGVVGRPDPYAVVELVTQAGGRRIVQMPYGEQLPRIC
jgi:hydrogenase expression/formation protein HypE